MVQKGVGGCLKEDLSEDAEMGRWSFCTVEGADHALLLRYAGRNDSGIRAPCAWVIRAVAVRWKPSQGQLSWATLRCRRPA